MSPNFETLLAEAYHLSQVQYNEPAAGARLRVALAADPELRLEAAAEQQRLASVIAARELGGQHGDHVSAVLHGLFAKALGGIS